MNQIDKLIAVKRICEAYGAQMQFRNAKLPIVIAVPYAGAQTGEIVRCFTHELFHNLGIWSEVNNTTVTFTL